MRTASFPRALIALVVVLGIVAAACSSSEPEEEATTVAADETAAEAVIAMCRTLALLDSAGAPAGRASEAIASTDLDGLTAQEKSAYGELLVVAPQQECSDQIDYADEIAYWLGF